VKHTGGSPEDYFLHTPKPSSSLAQETLTPQSHSGIGFAVAEASIESSATVTVSSSRLTSIESAISRISKSYPASTDKIRGFACDLATDEAEKNVEKLFEQTGKVDHIVFTAGDALAITPLQEQTLESIKKAGQIRFFAALIVAKIGSKYLAPGPDASITLTTGSVSLKPHENWSVVASYASGLHGMTRNLALDLKPVRVNLVSPGAVETELWDRMSPDAREAYFRDIAGKLPTGQIGQPEDVAECYLWLMKDKNVTGVVVQTDGGAMLV